MVQCYVNGCSSKTGSEKDLSFHKLPSKNPDLALEWKKFLAVTISPSDDVRVCNKHFTEDCFVRDFQVSYFTSLSEYSSTDYIVCSNSLFLLG